jgi:hypothetical protein
MARATRCFPPHCGSADAGAAIAAVRPFRQRSLDNGCAPVALGVKSAWYVGNDRLDILATTQLGRALFSELYATPTRPASFARFCFLDPRAESFYPDWDGAARTTAEILRAAAGRDPNDRELSDLVGELATKSDTFRTHPAVHNVRFHACAVRRFNHPASASSASASTASTSPPTTGSLSSSTPPSQARARGGAEPSGKLGRDDRRCGAGADD